MKQPIINNPPASLPSGSKVVAYVRDNGTNQEENIEQQEKAITDYCEKHGLLLSRIYAESASGFETEHQHQFLKMINTLMTCSDDERPRGLLLWSYSRFSRNTTDLNYYLYELQLKGMIIHSLTENTFDSFLALLLTTIANNKFNAKYIRWGIAEKVKEGYSGGGIPPKGYLMQRENAGRKRNGQQRMGSKWKVDPDLAPLVRLAWEMRSQGKSYEEITEATDRKIYTKKSSWISHFKNKSYLGVGKCGDIEVPDHHEPLITKKIWDAVQKIKSNYRQRGKPPEMGASANQE